VVEAHELPVLVDDVLARIRDGRISPEPNVPENVNSIRPSSRYAEPNTPGADAIVDEYADEYEWDDGETYHVPTDKERILLADFGHGLVSLLHENGLLKPRILTVEPAEPSREPTQEQVEDWELAALRHARANNREDVNYRYSFLGKFAALAYAAGLKAGSGT
jgi:hypothetical protein